MFLAELRPFRGLCYNQEKAGRLETLITPPYDVISPEGQRLYYRSNQYNVIRLDLGKDFPSDTPDDNKYTRAAHFFDEWQQEEVLRPNAKDAFYLYEQEYAVNNDHKKRKGFIGLIKLADFATGAVLPHERTMSKPKEDRLNLMNSTHANFSPIFSIYSDPEHVITGVLEDQKQNRPSIDFKDEDGIQQTVREITDRAALKQIVDAMADKTMFIADGHHRYETALTFQDLMSEKHPDSTGEESWNYVMMFFVNMDDEGLTILPVHRMLKNIDFNPLRFLTDARQYFDVVMLHSPEKLFEQMKHMDASGHAFGLYYGGNEYHLLTLKNVNIIDEMLSKEHSPEWKRLDVTLLHNIVLYQLLGLKGRDLEKEEIIEFNKDGSDAIDQVQRGKQEAVFFLNPTKIGEVRKIALNGERMPQKSTYFYPKPLTGLVINKLD
jgi:uncharacterized protein (DUF1015 family)